MKRSVFILLLLLTNHFAFSQKVKVVGISDGDTFTALFEDKHTERIRLYGIDCPEHGQPYSKAAKEYLSDMIFSDSVLLVVKDVDRFRRKVAIVFKRDSININEQMLIAGLAWHYKLFDKNPKWAELEIEARKHKAGLWAGSETPVAPWEWRFGNVN